jgi:hypothetical protein
MKILISSDGRHAHYFQRMAWANAFTSLGYQVMLWDCKSVPAFDIFDQFEPDIFLGQAYNLDEALIKCIYERPHLKVALRAGDWGDQEKEVDKSRYNILFCSKKEKELLKKLKDETGKPDFVHIHYSHADIKRTHNYFETIGIKPVSLMMCADTAVYGGAQVDPKLTCDVGFVGGYWPYKGQVIDQYLTPLLHPLDRYKVKIFGNQPWGVNQYCGLIDDQDVKNLFVSAKICPNLSEPHAQVYGIDVNERIFKILYAGGFCISDNVEAYKMFGDGIVIADSPDDFREKIEYYLNTDKGRLSMPKIMYNGQKFVAENHTGFHRIATIMEGFGYDDLSSSILKAYKDSLNEQN